MLPSVVSVAGPDVGRNRDLVDQHAGAVAGEVEEQLRGRIQRIADHVEGVLLQSQRDVGLHENRHAIPIYRDRRAFGFGVAGQVETQRVVLPGRRRDILLEETGPREPRRIGAELAADEDGIGA